MNWLLTGGTKIFLTAFSLIAGWLITLAALISQGVLFAANSLFNWVISDNFTSLSYTNPAGNPFIEVGFNLTRGLVNIVFILVLLAIGLGTALRLTNYQAKKALPLLIIMALLINFAPVLLGILVDASNIVMNFFFSGISSTGDFANRMSVIGHNFLGSYTFWNPTASIRATLSNLIIIFFNLFAAFIFLVFSLLFILRYIAIWLLVILSPLAFASYILPATRGLWNKWWNQFVQWSIIGIVGGFFLYLADKFIFLINTADFADKLNTMPRGTNSAFDFSSIINQMLPYGIAMALLFIGFLQSLQTSAQGTGMIINFAKKGGRAAGGTFAGMAARGARAVPGARRAEEFARRKLERAPVIGRALGGPGAYETARIQKLATAIKTIEKIPDTPQGNKDVLKRISGPALTENDKFARAAAIEVLAKRKELSDDAVKFIPEAQKFGANVKTIYQARPDYAQHLTTVDSTTKRLRPMTVEEVMGKIEPADIKLIQKESLKDPDVVLQAALDERKFDQMARHMKPELKKEFKNTFQTNTKLSRANLNPEHLATMKKRAKSLSSDPRWFPTDEETISSESSGVEQKKPKVILPGSKEFQEESSKIKRRLQ